ncbi:MAG: hypothetical protein HS128_02980 [Ideonella sp.]|nr:hypothetical protein [Ideonella sp.]
MARGHYVFDFDAEPSDERPTDYGTTNFGHADLALLSAQAPRWTVSQHSTFEEPSHASDRVRERREDKQLKARLTTLALLLATSAAGAAVYVAAG